MALIEWRDEFSVGVADVDFEHRQLIDLINATYAQLNEQNAAGTVLDFLGEIHTKISAHFALEERIMRERHYDQYTDHKGDHERLLDDIRDLMDAYEDNAGFDAQSFAIRLQEWFTEHFKTRDARLHKALG
ncbi:MAG: bacteriohemerythrin [Gammaproteobacteria bacterium]